MDTSRPDAGLHDIAVDGARNAGELLRVFRPDVASRNAWPLNVAESYVRGNDLVASYQASEVWPFAPQLYWRANSLHKVEGVIASISLLVSVQTHLLDTLPRIAVASDVPCEDAQLLTTKGASPSTIRVEAMQTTPAEGADCCVILRHKDLPLSFVEIMPAGDFHAVELRTQKNSTAFEWRLFAEFLEKGVIRRARVHAAVVSRDRDIEIAAACCTAIDSLELPLTT